jgi:coenzyme F420-reducing hydrogenase gamma subunit
MVGKKRPRLAVWKFASCDGCQLSLLDCEDELHTMAKGPYDLSLVEGSITTPHDEERINKVRRASKHLVTIGACATAGGIQALRNFADVQECVAAVYASPQYISTLATSTPTSAHVAVDFELHGCPKARDRGHNVCVECKLRGNTCVMVQGTPCLRPVTHAGCGALCPSYRRGCYGCFGPMDRPNTAALAAEWRKLGASPRDIRRVFRTFNAAAGPFRKESEAHGE